MSRFFMPVLSIALTAALLAGCAGPKPPRGGPGGPGGEMRGQMAALHGAYQAEPLALVLVSYDIDRDGLVSIEELRIGASSEWARMDAVGDGTVSAIDLSTWAEANLGSPAARPGRLAFDTDGDGAISHSEVTALMLKEFGERDKNGDGALDRSELVRQLKLPQMQQGGGRGRGPGQGDRRAPPSR